MSKKVRLRHQRRLKDEEQTELAVRTGLTRFESGTILAFGLAFCLAVAVEWGGGGPEGSLILTQWTPWRNLGLLRTAALLFVPLPLIAWALWRAETDRPAPALSLSLLAVASLALQALGLLADPRGLAMVGRIVASPGTTSYFWDADRIGSFEVWFRHFHQIGLGYHSMTHPPGPILFYYPIANLFGPSLGATVGGWVVGILASSGVLVMYVFAGLWTDDRRARLTASTFYTLIPALTLFFPEFDQVYPVLSMLLILFWVKAVRVPGVKAAIAAGAVLFLASFFAYNLLTLGAFLVYYGLYWWWLADDRGAAAKTLTRTSSIVLGAPAALYTALWLATGFNPIGALQRAIASQAVYALDLHRAYERFVVLDVYDFFLGAGMLAFPILVFHLRRRSWLSNLRQTDLALTVIGLATILTIDVSGLLRGETARVWLFAQPLLAVPVALELADTPWRRKLPIFALQWLILVFLKAKMTFVDA